MMRLPENKILPIKYEHDIKLKIESLMDKIIEDDISIVDDDISNIFNFDDSDI